MISDKPFVPFWEKNRAELEQYRKARNSSKEEARAIYEPKVKAPIVVPKYKDGRQSKRCPRCERVLDLSAFARRGDGRPQGWCKACLYERRYSTLKADPAKWEEVKRRAREWKRANRLKVTTYDRHYRSQHSERARAWYSQNRAQRRGIPIEVIRGDYVGALLRAQKGKCPACRKPLNGEYHIDHILPISLGGRHERLNLQLLHPACNRSKSNKDPIKFMQERGYLL